MTLIRVNKDNLRRNLETPNRANWKPVVSVWRDGERRAERGYGLEIQGPSRLIYDPSAPSVYLETEAEVVLEKDPP